MVKREHNTDEGTIDCHYFANGEGILCLITQVIDGEFESDNLLFAGRGETHEIARQNAFS
jgi:hypothetical protein